MTNIQKLVNNHVDREKERGVKGSSFDNVLSPEKSKVEKCHHK